MPFVDRWRIGLLSLALLSFQSCGSEPAAPPAPPPIAIVGAILIDGTPKPPQPNSAVLIREGKIAAIGLQGSVEIPPDAQRTNATGLYLTPGRGGLILAPGADAEIFLVNGNPLENPNLLATPMRKMKAGAWTDAPNQ
jgi:imidazolonepropionase-like amidohydrolase